MAYCVNCGVELGAGEARCPLCHTPVNHPTQAADPLKKPYPPVRKRGAHPMRHGVLALVSMLFVLPLVLCLLSDLLLCGGITWSLYAVGGIVLLYLVFVLPRWFGRPEPVSLAAADFAAAALFLFLIERHTGGSWFLSFALPVTAGAALIVLAVVALVRYVGRGYLFVSGGTLIAVGGYTMLIELLLNHTFGVRGQLLWSWFPMAACSLLGLMLIYIGTNRRMREAFERKLFL